MNYAIAYSDSVGNDFNTIEPDYIKFDVYGLQDAIVKARFIKDMGFKNVTIFLYDTMMPYKLNWDYILSRKVEFY